MSVMMNTKAVFRFWLVLFLCILCLAVPPAGLAPAVEPDEILADPAEERRARALSKRLHCPVCQGQSIDESEADLARALRRLLREQIQAGKSDTEILAFFTERYGEGILITPPLSLRHIGLWFLPVVVLVFALSLARRVFAGRAFAGPDRK